MKNRLDVCIYMYMYMNLRLPTFDTDIILCIRSVALAKIRFPHTLGHFFRLACRLKMLSALRRGGHLRTRWQSDEHDLLPSDRLHRVFLQKRLAKRHCLHILHSGV